MVAPLGEDDSIWTPCSSEWQVRIRVAQRILSLELESEQEDLTAANQYQLGVA